MRFRTPLSIVEAVLSFVGTAIAGTLYWAYRSHVDLPCSTGGGCTLVDASHWAIFLGVPVSLLGVCGYVVLLFAAVIKLTAESDKLAKSLLALMTIISAVGTAFSWYLQFVAAVYIGAFCIYCRSSAITMTLIFSVAICEILLSARSVHNVGGKPGIKNYV